MVSIERNSVHRTLLSNITYVRLYNNLLIYIKFHIYTNNCSRQSLRNRFYILALHIRFRYRESRAEISMTKGEWRGCECDTRHKGCNNSRSDDLAFAAVRVWLWALSKKRKKRRRKRSFVVLSYNNKPAPQKKLTFFHCRSARAIQCEALNATDVKAGIIITALEE